MPVEGIHASEPEEETARISYLAQVLLDEESCFLNADRDAKRFASKAGAASKTKHF